MRGPHSTVRTLDLPVGSLVPFTSNPGERVRILCGRVWLTEEGIRRDTFLASGEEARLDSRGLAVIEALVPARIELLEDAPATPRLVRATARPLRRLAVLARRWSPRLPRLVRGQV